MQPAEVKRLLTLVKELREQAHLLRAERGGFTQLHVDMMAAAAEALDEVLHSILEPSKEMPQFEHGYFVPAKQYIELQVKNDVLDRAAHVWILEAEEAHRDVRSKQAEIDRLMLEFCPQEMSVAQTEEWARNQVLVGSMPPQQGEVNNEGDRQVVETESAGVSDAPVHNNHAGETR